MKSLCCSLALAALLVCQLQAKPVPPPDTKDDKKPGPKADAKVLDVGTKGISIDATLSPADMVDPTRVNRYVKVYQVKLLKGKSYVIDMKSPILDSYLRLEDSKGRTLAEDDDSGGGPNGLDAQIRFTAPQEGVYRIVATSCDDGETGAFNLRVQER